MLAKAAKQTQFTKFLSPDSVIPTIEVSQSASPEVLRRARKVIGSFTWLVPEKRPDAELKWLSESALQDLEIPQPNAEQEEELTRVLSGEEAIIDTEKRLYPYAQNYGGHQFGAWAGQLGDGRAITLFKIKNYEIQLKGAGLTPYSRFADGKAVLRSSIREALASEYNHQLGIPTQRCLSLVNLPSTTAYRERIESCAVIARMTPSWVRIGSFELPYSRGDKQELRRLADYCVDELHLGEEGPNYTPAADGNRYFQFFRDTSLRNAQMMARAQAFGFLNGVLNSDNVSVLGLSIDYGPFAFMDTFDSRFTPNHDDSAGRYSFQSSPVIMWWNCIRLGETLGELIGAGSGVDDPDFIAKGITTKEALTAAEKHATELIMRVGAEFQATYEAQYKKLMLQRLGIYASEEGGDLKLLEELLHMMQECELDYNRFFRALSSSKGLKSSDFLPKERKSGAMLSDKKALHLIDAWLQKYNVRKERDPTTPESRTDLMNKLNPNFILRNSVLANAVELAERNEWGAFDAVAKMAANPFAESWSDVPEIFLRKYMAAVAIDDRGSQLSCSS